MNAGSGLSCMTGSLGTDKPHHSVWQCNLAGAAGLVGLAMCSP